MHDQVGPGEAKQGPDHQRHLENGGGLAERVGRGFERALAPFDHQRAEEDQEVATQDQNREPGRETAESPDAQRQEDNRRVQEDLVGERIEYRPQTGPLAEAAGEVAVQSVAPGGQGEDRQGQIVVAAAAAGVKAEDEIGEDGGEEEAQESDDGRSVQGGE
jgi:hypothetical protein